MAISADDIVGRNPDGTPLADATQNEAPGEFPEALQQIPALVPLFEGKPPATYATQADQTLPELQAIQPNLKALTDLGFGVFVAPDESVEVLYNSAHIEPSEVQLAFEQNRLDDIAIPFSELVSSTRPAQAGTAAPAASAASVGGGTISPSPVEEKLATTRIKNIALGSPTSGPSPGSGRILNAIQKQVV